MSREYSGIIKVSGGLFSSHFVSSMQNETTGFNFADISTFSYPWEAEDSSPDKKEYDMRLTHAWDDLIIRWDTYGHKLNTMDPEDARKYWQRPLMEALGFRINYTPKQIEISDKIKFSFSHKGWFPSPDIPTPPVTHLIPPTQGFDTAPAPRVPCAHDALQAYLNIHNDKWAIVTNGHALRLIREYHHTTTKGYVEFDLGAMFLQRSYKDFHAMYRFVHASRFVCPPPDKADTASKKGKTGKTGKTIPLTEMDDADVDIEIGDVLDLVPHPRDTYIEEYFKHSQAVGETVGKDLRVNVIKAIETLGNGFLDTALLTELRNDDVKAQKYYEEILKIVYRIVFMLYAEQRGILGGDGSAADSGHDLYLEEYSITALREQALKNKFSPASISNTLNDLWKGLQITFEILKTGEDELGVYAYNGRLFDIGLDEYTTANNISNGALLESVRCLTLTDINKSAQRISYADLSVEEIGSIYESLLDYAPKITDSEEEIYGRTYPPNSFFLDPRGSARRTSGSYYTNPGLVEELIKSALVPVIEDRLAKAGPERAAREKVLLSIKVCDTSGGSGAFLIAANNRLGLELAKIRTGTDLPSMEQLHEARRDVLQHCIYGVDLNPMAVELAKVSLWINASVKNKPLNYLDHHIKCGNSLVGSTLELLKKGVPTDAFERVATDEKNVSKAIKDINKTQLKTTTLGVWGNSVAIPDGCIKRFAELAEEDESNPASINYKKELYQKLIESHDYREAKLLADLWTSAFFWKLTDPKAENPTHGVFSTVLMHGRAGISPEMSDKITDMAARYRFFHWHLEFPDVFGREDPGFDCVLGNPPWERIKIQETEFFEHLAPEISNAANASARKTMIKQLQFEQPVLKVAFEKAKRDSECTSHFLRKSDRFPLTGRGDVNTYTVFSELARRSIRANGKAGIIVPSGIATDKTTAEFFGDLVSKNQLSSLYDIENKKKLFPIHSMFKFCLLIMSGKVGISQSDLTFFIHDLDELNDKSKHFTLTPTEIWSINPNTGNCPIFRTKRDAEITKGVYQRIPILINKSKKTEVNPWAITFLRMFDMSNDSGLFKESDELDAAGFELEGNHYVKDHERFLPLYEAKMFQQFDHRFGSFEGVESRSNTNLPTPNDSVHSDPNYVVQPWNWISKADIDKRVSCNVKSFIGYRKISNATNERTFILNALPYTAFGDSVILIFPQATPSKKIGLIANLGCIPFDFIVRKKMGGTNLSYFILEQLPVIPPTAYTQPLIAPRAIELTYTAWDLEPFAQDVLNEIGTDAWNQWFPQNPIQNNRPQPFKWDTERRFQLRAELDAIYAHLYGITRDDLDYILGTFPIVKKKDEKKYGTFRTHDLVLEYYDKYQGTIQPVNKEKTV